MGHRALSALVLLACIPYVFAIERGEQAALGIGFLVAASGCFVGAASLFLG